MTTRFLLAAACAAALVCAAPAGAQRGAKTIKPERGTYAGKTADGDTIRFKVVRRDGRLRIVSARMTVTIDCSDGSTRTGTITGDLGRLQRLRGYIGKRYLNTYDLQHEKRVDDGFESATLVFTGDRKASGEALVRHTVRDTAGAVATECSSSAPFTVKRKR